MSDGLSCDRCGKTLLVDEDVRYTAEVKVTAAYDVLEVTAADLEKDHKGEIARILASIEASDASAEDLAAEVASVRRLDLCPSCAKAFREDPFGGR